MYLYVSVIFKILFILVYKYLDINISRYVSNSLMQVIKFDAFALAWRSWIEIPFVLVLGRMISFEVVKNSQL
jgi:hypothetical protein